MKDLGSRLYLDSGTLTPLLKKLEAKKIITLSKGKKDGRELVISLTKKGLQLKEQAYEVPQTIGGCVKLEKDEAITLYKLLYKVLSGLENE